MSRDHITIIGNLKDPKQRKKTNSMSKRMPK